MNALNLINSKIYTIESFTRQLNIWKFKEKKIVFTNGCFDILHLGHIDYLSKAAALGDLLIVGLNTDASIHRIKGNTRPIIDEQSRKMALASMVFIDAVILFEEETPYELIKAIQPDILVKGSDYKAEDVVGYDIVKAKNGEVITIDLVQGYSTTSIISKINNLA